MEGRDLDRFIDAYGADFKFHDENIQMLSWYVARMAAAVKRAGARSLLSLGVGHEVVSRTILSQLAGALEEYTIIEGAPEIVRRFLATRVLPPHVRVVNAFFEDFEPPAKLDAIEMGFVLEHVDDPLLVLRRFAGFLKAGGLLIVVVPNARSLHRLFGHHAGLLDDLYRLSEHDLSLGHKRYFDLASITDLVTAAGLRVLRREGVFLKCLTTGQLAQLPLPPAITHAFFRVGVEYPEISNAIYLETTL